MSLALQICFVAYAGIAAFYLYAFVRFYGIVKAEKPEWLNIRGSLSFLYDALPRIGDPNVQIELHRIAFGPRSRQLQSPMAVSYANRIRLLGGSALALFIIGVIGFIASAPQQFIQAEAASRLGLIQVLALTWRVSWGTRTYRRA